MKNIFKFITICAAAVTLASCEYKAQFHDASIVSFNGDRASIKEDAGKAVIPISIFSKETATVRVAYTITDDTAKRDEDYVDSNISGIVTVSNDPDVTAANGIEISVSDANVGELTGNKVFYIELKNVADEDESVHLGNTIKCKVTIIDIDGGLNLLVGGWSGSGKDSKGAEMTWDLVIEEYDPSKEEDPEYPDANLQILEGWKIVDQMTNSWDSIVPAYGRFNEDTNQVEIYGGQWIDGGNFGDPYGVLYLGFVTDATFNGGEIESFYFDIDDDGALSLRDHIWTGLFREDGSLYQGLYTGELVEMTLTLN